MGQDDKKNQKKAKKKVQKKEREKLQSGVVINSEKYKYTIIKLLGSGGFGDVYLVDHGGPKKYAMKTEEMSTNKMMLRLKMEVQILSACQKAPAERRKYFVEYLDRGITPKFKFVVMGLVGPSIEDIRKKILCDNFSSSTAIRICQQTLQSVWDLHEVGYIHRDIKACNFAVGLDPNTQSTVYMLDFGIARAWCEKNSKTPKVPRDKVKFLGTVRFCSRACHRGKDQGRKDDLETWIYMCLDVFDEGGIPWRMIADREDVLAAKDKFMANQFRCFRLFPKEFQKITTYVDGLHYADEPDYKFIFSVMSDIVRKHRINTEKDFDWAGQIGKQEKKKDGEEETGSNELSGSGDDDDDSGKKKKDGKSNKKGKKVAPPPIDKTRVAELKKKNQKNQIKKQREKLKAGLNIESAEQKKYIVISLLGSGGFGDVYLVDRGDPKKYALKTEMNDCNPAMARLKFETDILVTLNKADSERKKYFVPYIDRGQTEKFKFMVMGLVGPSLDDIRKKIIEDNFSKSTAIRVCRQSLQAVADFHDAGFLHRDIKPCNFAVGADKDCQTIVYMLDFGIARKYTQADTKIPMPPREKVKFLGTIRFCSRACHQLKEQGRKDDVETWIYMCLDVFDDIGIPWKLMAKREDVAEAKDKFFKLGFKCFKIFPAQFKEIMKYVDELKFEDEPDYKKIDGILEEIIKAKNIDVTKPYDWEGKIDQKKDKKDAHDSDKSDNVSGSGSEGDDDGKKKGKKGGKSQMQNVPKKSTIIRRAKSVIQNRSQHMGPTV